MTTIEQLVESTNLKQCLEKREHSLIEIQSRHTGFDCYNVVRWCTTCGAVVVDGEIDNRVNPGQVMRMKLPALTYTVGRKMQEEGLLPSKQ
jgi:hypothetical protein